MPVTSITMGKPATAVLAIAQFVVCVMLFFSSENNVAQSLFALWPATLLVATLLVLVARAWWLAAKNRTTVSSKQATSSTRQRYHLLLIVIVMLTWLSLCVFAFPRILAPYLFPGLLLGSAAYMWQGVTLGRSVS
jgi:cytochrome bd-type quinol oxidase subunit 2